MNSPLLATLQHLLEQKSQELNLFSAGDRLKIGEKHIPDALTVLGFWTPPKGARVMDLGTGGGLPGLALAVACEEAFFTLVDAREKKVAAVQAMIAELGLKNARAVAGRLEEAHEKKFREQFDVVTARALAPLPVLLEYAAGFLKVGGRLYAWKGSEWEAELKASEAAQTILGLHFLESFHYRLPSGEERVIVSFEKTVPLPQTYPRRTGVPSQKPL